MELQTTHGQMPTQIQYSPNQVALGKQVRRLSLAGNPSFPIPDIFIVDYVKTIEEQEPEITPPILQKMVNMMLTGKLPYDVNKGIRNIFEGFEEYKKIRKHYYLFNIETGAKDFATEDTDFNLIDKSLWKLIGLRKNNERYELESYRGNDFEILSKIDLEFRERHLRDCSYKNIQPQPFKQWLDDLNAAMERNTISKTNRPPKIACKWL